MEIKLLKKEKDSMEIEIIGENDTLLAPLLQQLLDDDKVEFATFRRGHLSLENPVIVVKVVEGKPQMALKRAAKAVANDYKEMRSKFDKIKS
jgi:DNA-directed RNA polymerase subunit L